MSIFDKLKGWLGGKAPPEPEPEPEPVVPAAPEAAPAAEAAPPEEPAPEDEETEEADPAPRWTAADDAQLDSEARALFADGDASRALELLGERGLLFACHEARALPCLCRKCATPEGDVAEHAGIAFVRDFVVKRRRVLFYWMPAELAGDAKQVRASMRAAVEDQLRPPPVHSTEPRQGINPFTKQPVTIQPKGARLRINPLTGKPLP